MSILLLPIGSDGQAYNDANGNPRSGAQLFIYLAGTSTKATLYQDKAGAANHTNPIVLNSSGQVANGSSTVKPIFVDSGSDYDVVLAPSTDTDPPVSPYFTLEDITPINDIGVSGGISEWILGGTPTYVSPTSLTLAGDVTSTYHVGRRIKTTNSGGTIYSTITVSAYTTLTTLTVVNDTGTLDSGLSDISYSLLSADNYSIPTSADYVFTGSVNVGLTGEIKMYGGSLAPTNWLLCDGTSYLRTDYTNLFAVIGTAFGAADGTHFNVPDMRNRSPIGAGTGTTTEAVTASSSNGFTVAANNTKWITGMPVILSNLSGFTTSATAGPTYYAVRISSVNVRLATTLALAQAGTPDVTISGTGTCIVTYTMTARTLGEIGGEESHAQSSTELLSHTHTYGPGAGGGGSLYNDASGGNSLNRSGSTYAAQNFNTGGNTAMNIMQPFNTVNYIIKT